MAKKFEHTGFALKQFRLAQGRTQSEMAIIGDCHAQFVSNAERGLCELPTKVLKRIVSEISDKKFREAWLNAKVRDCQARTKQQEMKIFGKTIR